jgi:hypothetical protein
MVRAIFAGRKTQTRRVVTMREFGASTTPGYDFTLRDRRGLWNDVRLADVLSPPHRRYPARCPYGEPGDLLWVRECWQHFGNGSAGNGPVRASVRYRTDGAIRQRGQWDSFEAAPQRAWWNTGRLPWASPRFMPRWASRLTLHVTDVRVQRVQEITEVDAIAEGMATLGGEPDHGPLPLPLPLMVRRFAALWDGINAGRGFGWESNCWVWAVSFEVAP